MNVSMTDLGNGNLVVIQSIDEEIYGGIDLKETRHFRRDWADLLVQLSGKVNEILLEEYYTTAVEEFKVKKNIGRIKDIHVLTNGDVFGLSLSVPCVFFLENHNDNLGSALSVFTDKDNYDGFTLHLYVNDKSNNDMERLIKERFDHNPRLIIHNTDSVIIRGNECVKTYRFDSRYNIESVSINKTLKLG